MNFIWDNIYLNKQERERLIVLLIIFGVLLVLKFCVVVFYEPLITPIDPSVLDSIEMVKFEKKQYYPPKKKNNEYVLEKSDNTKSNIPTKKSSKKPTKTKIEPITFNFDPNTTSKDSLYKLGLASYTVNSLLKYRSKGGKIKSKEQFSKMNGMDENTYSRIESFIQLPKSVSKPNYTKSNSKNSLDSVSKPTKKYTKYKKKAPKLFEINTGDTTDFMNLYGIGRVYSNRIIKYRSSLGGFFSVDQVNEVWGINDSLFNEIKPYFDVDPAKIKKRNINQLNKDALNKHPYINWRKSKAILAYKGAHGNYKSMDDFYKLHLLEDEFVDTLKYYFIVE